MRMNLAAVLIAPHYGALAADMWQMAQAKPADMQLAFELRKTELCEAYGLQPKQTERKPFAFADGIAIIPIHGTLINRFGGSYGSVTGYNFVRGQTQAAASDADVKMIVYDVNSYGGEAAGCFECASDMRNIATKAGIPTLAVVDSNCYSAAYALASAADKISVIPSGGAGSIGVVAMHIDVSKALTDFGVKITFIHDGDHKIDGNPFEPLSAEVKADIQSSVNKSGTAFRSLVSNHRGISEKAVKDMQARIYRADEAKELGLIDAVATPSQAVQAFFAELSGSALSTTPMEQTMTTETKPGDKATQDATNDQAIAKAAADARTAEKARISGIQGCDEAKGRTKLASHLAMNTEMSVDDAKGILAAAPAEVVEKTAEANPFNTAMNASGNPEVGADVKGGGGTQDASADKANEILGVQAKHGSAQLKLVDRAA